jgi:hypothetical protein
MHPWSQIVSLALAVLDIVVAILPRTYPGGLKGQSTAVRLTMGPKLRRFPIFWLGLGLLIYIASQGLNPSWYYVHNVDWWWLVRRSNIPWLPTSIAEPFARSNAWRQLIIYAAPWLMVCAAWVGFTRRRSLRLILTATAVNAIAIGMALTYQHITGDMAAPWPLSVWTARNVTGSFIYENHAGAYLGLSVFIVAALACRAAEAGKRNLVKSTPAGALAIAALFLVACVFLSRSRGASLCLVAAGAIFFGWHFWPGRRRLGLVPADRKATLLIVLLIFALFGSALHFLNFSDIYQRFGIIVEQKSKAETIQTRVLGDRAALQMLREHWVRGVGAGCFRHLFTEYVKAYPMIYDHGYYFWEHAHCDWLELPIELGLPGDLILAAGCAWWFRWFYSRRFFLDPFAMPLLIGCSALLVYGTFDFPFQCPAILSTWCVLIVIAAKGAERRNVRTEAATLDRPGGGRQ